MPGLEVAGERAAELREAMDAYVSAVLEAAGHPVRDLERLTWSGPCGHVWIDRPARPGEPTPPPCPLCQLREERDLARDVAVALETELAAAAEPAPEGTEWLTLRLPVSTALLAGAGVDELAGAVGEVAADAAELAVRELHRRRQVTLPAKEAKAVKAGKAKAAGDG